MAKLNEQRSSNIMQILKDLGKSDFIEKIVDIRGMTDGFTAFVRGKDGNAYEIEIRPASLARSHDEIRGAGKYAERKKKKKDQIRKNMGL